MLTETLDDGGANEVTTKFTYDAVSNLLTQIDDYTPVPSNGFNYQTDFDYDALNRLTTETVYPDADTFIETASAYDALGNLVRVTETTTSGVSPNQLTHEVATEFGYDDLGRQTHLTRDAGRDLQSTSRFAYDAVGNLLSTVDPLGQISRNSYDRLDRLDESIAPDPDGGGGSVPAAISKFTYDVAGNLATQTNGDGETERFFYDSLDRLIRSHDGRDVTLDAPTLRSYDSEGNLLTFTDPVGNTTSYAYDDLDRLTSETITLGVNAVSRDYVYNAQGNLEEVVDRNGRQRTFEYDRLDRRTYERWWNSTNDEIATLGWQYDSLGRVTQARDTQDADTSPDHYVESFFYDALDRVTAHYNYDASATLATTNPPVVQLYAYDLLEASDASDFVRTGYQQWVVDAFGFATLANSTFFTDRLGRLARLTETAGAVDNLVEKQIDFAYDANDRLTGIRRVSGQFDTGYAYDRAGRVTGISHLATGNSQLPFTSYSYGYDKADRIIGQISEHDKTLGAFSDSSVLATDVELFQFDDAGQLKQDGQRTYDYDAGGNRDDASITVGEHNRLLEDANYGYIYDLEGNLTTRFVDSIDNGVFDPGEDYTVYTWDYRNRLTRVKDFNGTTLEENTKYRYNADDQQVEREAFIGAFQTAHEHYVYDGAQRVLALDPDGDLKHRYTWGPGVDQLLVDEVFDSSTNLVEETLFAANDHLGSVNQLVDNSGTVVEHREYDSFGAIDKVFDEAGSKVYDKTDPAANLNVLQSTVAFAGREIDVASGLYYNRARWYDSASGRFISVDPAEDGNNWYAYAGSDPINFRDPFGFSAQHPLDVFAGGHGSGVVVPQNTNIVSGSTANSGSALNSFTNAVRNVGNFIADTASDAFRSFNPLASAAINAGAGLGLGTIFAPVGAPGNAESSLFSRLTNNGFTDFFGRNLAKSRDQVVTASRAFENAVFETTAGARIIADERTNGLRNQADSRFLSQIGEAINSSVQSTTQLVDSTVFGLNAPARIADDFNAFSSLGIGTGTSSLLAVGQNTPVLNSFFALEELGSGLSNRASDFNAPLTRQDKLQRAGAVAVDAAVSILAVSTRKPGARTSQKGARDITLDDVVGSINHNADVATELARRAAARGRITNSSQAFGTRAHKLFERLNGRLDRRLAEQGSTFRVIPEEFRNASGSVVDTRAKGSIGADAIIQNTGDPSINSIFDLKTHGGIEIQISPARQGHFQIRFGAQAQEIFRQR